MKIKFFFFKFIERPKQMGFIEKIVINQLIVNFARNVPLYTVYNMTMSKVYTKYSVYTMYKVYTIPKIYIIYRVYTMYKVYTVYCIRLPYTLIYLSIHIQY